MKKFMILILIIVVPALTFSEGNAYHGSNFIKFKNGARAKALGVAYLGFSDDSNVLFWNPAASVTLNESNFMSGIGVLEYDTFIGNAGFIISGSSFSIGAGALALKYTDIPKYDASGNESGNISNLQGYGLFNSSFLLTDFSSIGFTAKGGYMDIEDKKTYVGAASFGVMVEYILQFVLVIDDVGISWDEIEKETQHLNPDFNFSLSYVSKNNDDEKIFGVALTFNRGIDLPDEETKVGVGSFIRIWGADQDIEDFFESKKRLQDSIYFNVGFEYYHGSIFSAGITLNMFGIKTDYAIVFPSVTREEFSHYASVEFRF